jgi:hypothetical protein
MNAGGRRVRKIPDDTGEEAARKPLLREISRKKHKRQIGGRI